MSGVAGGPARFSPDIPPVQQSPRPELLGRFVPVSIKRLPAMARVIHPFRIAVTGICTLGVVPLMQLRSRLDKVIIFERQQLELASELVTAHVPLDADDSATLAAAAGRVRKSGLLSALITLAMLASVIFAILIFVDGGWTLATLRRTLLWPPSATEPLRLAWLVSLTGGYLLLLLEINRHIALLHGFALAYNAIVGEAGRVERPKNVFGLRPGHLTLAVVMMLLWMVWALPMMLAWGGYTSFIRRQDRPFRHSLGDSLQALSGTIPVVQSPDRCRNSQCNAVVPKTAVYCPRCGRSVAVP